jgi:cytochrome P450
LHEVKTISPLSLFRLPSNSDPNPLYDALLEQSPIHWCAPLNRWFVVGYDAVREILRDDSFHSDNSLEIGFPRVEAATKQSFPGLRAFAANSATALVSPRHEAARRLLVRVLAHRPVAALRPFTEALTQSVVGELCARGTFDLIEDFAWPIAAGVAAEILGLPPEDLPGLRMLTHDLMGTIDTPLLPLRTLRRHEETAQRGITYFKNLLTERGQTPRDDGLTIILQGMRPMADEDAMAATGLFMICAGIEVTGSFIAYGGTQLLRNAALRTSLRDSPAGVSAVVDRLLSEGGPFHGVNRIASADRLVQGFAIPVGSRLTLLLAAANRDLGPVCPHAQGDRHPHLAFGDGAHLCLGSALARMEASVAFQALAHLPSPAIVEESIIWSDRLLLRSMLNLTINLNVETHGH